MATLVRDLTKVPIINDPRPRTARLSLDADLSSGPFQDAYLLLKQMAESRGYHDLNTSDIDLYVPSTCEFVGARIVSEFKVRLHLVPCSMLKTNFTWLIRFGQDAVLSAPSD